MRISVCDFYPSQWQLVWDMFTDLVTPQIYWVLLVVAGLVIVLIVLVLVLKRCRRGRCAAGNKQTCNIGHLEYEPHQIMTFGQKYGEPV